MTVPTTEHRVPGLEHPAEIVVDRWGIPHIRAASQHDVFFAQGFNIARDRLYQIDLWRKRGLGLMAGDYGPGFLAQDRAARLFLYRGDMQAEWDAYGNPATRAICTAFADGINAYIAAAGHDASLLPPEFAAMGIAPARWSPEDVLRVRSHALSRNVEHEAARAQVAARVGLEAYTARMSLEPAWELRLPDGLDPADIPPEVLDVYWLATVDPDISPERLAAPRAQAWRWTKVNDFDEVRRIPRRRARTTGWCRAAAPRPGSRSSPPTRTASTATHRCATWCT